MGHDWEKACKNMEKRNDSLHQALIKLEANNKILGEMNMGLMQEKAQWQTDKASQKDIIAEQLGVEQKTIKRLQDEIMELREKIKNGNNN